MKRIPIHFFSESIDFTLKKKTSIRKWIRETIISENYLLKGLTFIFCSDAYLLDMNVRYLNHHTFTDVITFDHSEKENRVLGDIFISIDRIRENARQYQVNDNDELHRVMIHGVLHLVGYRDKTPADKTLMRSKENHYLLLSPLANNTVK